MLRHYWPLDESTGNTAYDDAGNWDAIVYGDAGDGSIRTDGRFGNARDLQQGTDGSYIELWDGPDGLPLWAEWSFNLWFRRDDTADFTWSKENIWACGEASSANTGPRIYAYKWGDGLGVAVDIRYDDGAIDQSLTHPDFATSLNGSGQWHMYTLTSDGTVVRLYLDGSEMSSAAVNMPLQPESVHNLIGGFNDVNETWLSVDDIGLWDHALEPSSVSRLWSDGVGLTADQWAEPTEPLLQAPTAQLQVNDPRYAVDILDATQLGIEWRTVRGLLMKDVTSAGDTRQTFYNPTESVTDQSNLVAAAVSDMYQEITASVSGSDYAPAVAVLSLVERLISAAVTEQSRLRALALIEQVLNAYDTSRDASTASAVSQVETSSLIRYARTLASQLVDQIVATDVAEHRLLIVLNVADQIEASDTSEFVGRYRQLVENGLLVPTAFKLTDELNHGWVMNTEGQRPISQYENYDFNAFCVINGRGFGTSDEGLFALGGDDDDGEPIAASLRSMMLDFGSTRLKRVTAAYLGYTADNRLLLKVRSVDDGKLVENWYEASGPAAVPQEGFRPLGRGARSRYWQFELANVDGGEFEVDKLELYPVYLGRRI